MKDRPLQYIGLPRVIANLIAREPLGALGGRVEVRAVGSALGEEERKRRRNRLMNGGGNGNPHVVDTEDSAGIEEEVGSLLLNNLKQTTTPVKEVKGTVTQSSISHNHPSTSPPTDAVVPTSDVSSNQTLTPILSPPSETDPTVLLILSSFSSKISQTLSLSSLSLTSLAVPSSPPTQTSSITSLDLSKNHFVSTPFQAIVSGWGWNNLRKLSLRGNRIRQFDTSSGVKLEELEVLDLEGNRLENGNGNGKGNLFEEISNLAPKLQVLDLSMNSMQNIDGVEQVLLRNGGRLKELKLNGNKIEDVEGLCVVAKRIENGEGDKWKCFLIDLQNNEIGRVRFSLDFPAEEHYV